MKHAFTIIELLIVVSVLGILSGVTVSVINSNQKAKNAKDAVVRTDLEKLVQVLESYCTAESSCASDADFTSSSSLLRTNYILVMPSPVPAYNAENNNRDFEVYMVLNSYSPVRYLKYNSIWGVIKECSATGIATFGTCGT